VSPFVGAVLTGGASRRMGRTKAVIAIDGVPMGTLVAAALRSAGCTSVLAYGGDPDELAALGLPVLPDRHPGSGPLGGVLGVLEHLESQDDRPAGVFVMACDLPATTGSDLLGMVAAARDHPDVDVVVARTSALEPTCAIWSLSAIDEIRRCFDEGERALHVVIGRLATLEVDVDPAALCNINTPEELARYS
jgi:molybdopterin-guanine dinucleotide biosynthesis protein A